ncbi:hypothetical protein SAMN04488084_102198 [Pedobacter antarcticus]|nr:hypothetical protein SAMN04488084_102198 [Pedobacter antarcticus]SFE87309.1 hypothetical protein SAMN03003324_01609 [Pedobacter antarcticus]
MKCAHRQSIVMVQEQHLYPDKMSALINYFTVNTVVELICLIIGTCFIFNEKQPAWWIFYGYIFLTCIVEFTGIHLRLQKLPNMTVYNIFLIPEGIVISYFFYSLYQKYTNKIKWLIAWIGIFLIFWIAETLSDSFQGFAFNTSSFISISFVLASLYYYYLILKDPNFEKLGSYAPFWWVNGVLFYYFGTTAINIFFDYLLQDNIYTFPHSIRYNVIKIVNVFLYSCWSYAFICRYHQRKSST